MPAINGPVRRTPRPCRPRTRTRAAYTCCCAALIRFRLPATSTAARFAFAVVITVSTPDTAGPGSRAPGGPPDHLGPRLQQRSGVRSRTHQRPEGLPTAPTATERFGRPTHLSHHIPRSSLPQSRPMPSDTSRFPPLRAGRQSLRSRTEPPTATDANVLQARRVGLAARPAGCWGRCALPRGAHRLVASK